MKLLPESLQQEVRVRVCLSSTGPVCACLRVSHHCISLLAHEVSPLLACEISARTPMLTTSHPLSLSLPSQAATAALVAGSVLVSICLFVCVCVCG